MEILALNKEHLESFVALMGKYESGDHKAFMFLIEDKKKSVDLKVVNGVAKIKITGILGNSWYYDTEYQKIIQQTIEAENREDVKSIDFIIDSPGGLVSGCEECGRMIAQAQKPTRAVVKNLAASAAYWLASQADKIVVTNESAQVGSIGVMAVVYDFKKYLEKEGIKEIKIISSNAPDKNPDPATEKGFKKYQAEIDKLHEIFAKNVAKGRKCDILKVNEEFGRGGVLFSIEAKEVDMIDEISMEIEGLENNKQELKTMTKANENEKTITAADLEAAVTAAKEEGIKAERERVKKHLSYIGSAKNETILANIENGSEFSACVEKYAEEKYAKIEIDKRANENQIPAAQTGPIPIEEKPEEKSAIKAHKEMFGKK